MLNTIPEIPKLGKRVNDPIITPNGPGIVEGRQIYGNGTHWILVRHEINKMVPAEKRKSGMNLFPKAIHQTIWAYPIEDLQRCNNGH